MTSAAYQYYYSTWPVDFNQPWNAGTTVYKPPTAGQVADGLAQGMAVCVNNRGEAGMCVPCGACEGSRVPGKVVGWPPRCDFNAFGRSNLPGFCSTSHLQ